MFVKCKNMRRVEVVLEGKVRYGGITQALLSFTLQAE
jgi:hypothetical protein